MHAAKNHRLWLIASLLGASLIALSLTDVAYLAARQYWRLMFEGGQARWAIPLAFLMLVSNVALDQRLRRLNYAVLEWSPFGIKANINELPIKVRYLGWAYAVLLGYCVPIMAWFEEFIFRNRGATWLWGLSIGVFAFAVAHLLACVSVRMLFCLALAGGELVIVYMMSGFWAAVLTHATFNFLAIGWVLYELKLQQPLRTFVQTAWFKTQFPTVMGWYSSLKLVLTRPSVHT
jgi:hypothetical protein